MGGLHKREVLIDKEGVFVEVPHLKGGEGWTFVEDIVSGDRKYYKAIVMRGFDYNTFKKTGGVENAYMGILILTI